MTADPAPLDSARQEPWREAWNAASDKREWIDPDDYESWFAAGYEARDAEVEVLRERIAFHSELREADLERAAVLYSAEEWERLMAENAALRRVVEAARVVASDTQRKTGSCDLLQWSSVQALRVALEEMPNAE